MFVLLRFSQYCPGATFAQFDQARNRSRLPTTIGFPFKLAPRRPSDAASKSKSSIRNFHSLTHPNSILLGNRRFERKKKTVVSLFTDVVHVNWPAHFVFSVSFDGIRNRCLCRFRFQFQFQWTFCVEFPKKKNKTAKRHWIGGSAEPVSCRYLISRDKK